MGNFAPVVEEERIAALTGSQPGRYVKAIMGPASKEACRVQFSLVHPGPGELTGQLHNGVLPLDGASAVFDMELVFGNSGASSALICRQCFGQGTAKLFYLAKDPAKLAEGGEWVWAAK